MSHKLHIYEASAGTGKTYTLVKEYLKKLFLSNTKNPHKSLLAITFTNKAASEMKSRIIDALFYFSGGALNTIDKTKQTLYNDLKSELGYSDKEMFTKSKMVLSRIIHNYGFFSVCTIDKFVHKIIRGFCYELDLPAHFEVEMNQEKIIKESVFSLLDELIPDTDLTNNLIRY